MKVLVPGGAGYTGSVLVESLVQNGYDVTVVDIFKFGENTLNNLLHYDNFKIFRQDVRSLKKDFIKNFDCIIPLSAIVGAPACNLYFDEATSVNRDSIKMICDNLSKNQMLIYPTTNSGYGATSGDMYCDELTPLNPISHYGILKKEAEDIVMQRENSICFRMATVFGVSYRPRTDLLVNDFVYKAYFDKSIVLFEPHFKRNYIHVRDVSNAYIYSIKNFNNLKSEIYNLGLSDANLSKLELCERIKLYVKDLNIFQSEHGKDPDKRNYIVSNDKIEKKGYKATITVDQGIKELLKYYSIISKKNSNI